MKKDLEVWFKALQTRGKIILGLAVVGFLWLLFQIINAIAGIVDLNLGIFGIILNILCITLISLVVAQFLLMRSMMKNQREMYREMSMRGRRGGNRMEQVSGVRNAGSMRRRGSGGNMAQAMQMMTQVKVEDLDKHYRPKPIAKPTIIADWKEITEAGLYALEATPKQKIEIIDASDLGGGFFVGRYGDGILKERTMMTHRQSGEPLRFSTLRNAKQALSGKKVSSGGRRKKKKK